MCSPLILSLLPSQFSGFLWVLHRCTFWTAHIWVMAAILILFSSGPERARESFKNHPVMLNCNAHDESAARTLYTSLNNRLDKLTPAGELSDRYRLPPSHVSPILNPLFLAPAQRTFTAAELVKGGKFRGRSNANSMDARAAEISGTHWFLRSDSCFCCCCWEDGTRTDYYT